MGEEQTNNKNGMNHEEMKELMNKKHMEWMKELIIE